MAGKGELGAPERDRELVAACLAAGERYDAAFEAIYQRFSARVYGFLLGLCSDAEAAQDALQETFLRVYRSLDKFDPERDLLTWLLQVARYVAIDRWRVEAKVKRLEEQVARARPDLTPAAAPADLEAGERRALVRGVLAGLSPDDRSLLLLRHFHGLTYGAIGAAVDCSERTAQNRVEAAARRFTRALLLRRAETP